jgi:hypothetical protein
MKLNYKVLEERVRSAMIKYGIEKLDREVLYIMNNAMETKYQSIIKELISISRTS